MKECLYCGEHSFEDSFSLRRWANGFYCSVKCLNDDISEAKATINYYENEIKDSRNQILKYENGRSNLSKEEIEKIEEELRKARSRHVATLQKLTHMESLQKLNKLRYKESEENTVK
ncbi:hypothetical protein ACQPVP_09175 [Clostridium nigeriense]|uniref:hypothetical protein n=1 Tax=Clostridium nigeriense TaxID=1805470 RepID=UPI003D348E3B